VRPFIRVEANSRLLKAGQSRLCSAKPNLLKKPEVAPITHAWGLTAKLSSVRGCPSISWHTESIRSMNRCLYKLAGFAVLTMLAITAQAVDIRFENTPELGLPNDAREQRCDQAGSLGSLQTIVPEDLIRHIKIRYFNDKALTQTQVKNLIQRLFEDNKTQVYCFPAWANLLMEPAIEGVVYYDSFRQGKLLIWGCQAVLQKPDGDWLFIFIPKNQYPE